MIYESGQVVAFFSADIQSQCWTMDFSAYPRDTHKCEFLIYSPIYHKVGKIFQLQNELSTGFIFKDVMTLRTTLYKDWLIQSALPFKVAYSSLPEIHIMTIGNIGNFSTAGFYVHLDRYVLPFIVNIYIPTTLAVIISWIR